MAAEIVASDGNLVQDKTGAIYDTESGLEWYPGPDQGMTWQDANAWVATLPYLGGGWRMPASDELNALHRIGDGVCNLSPLVALSGYWLWAGQTEDTASRWVFRFSYGGEGWSGQPPADGGRAIAVRERRRHH